MRQELNTVLGIYRPSFLKIFVDRDEDFSDLNQLEDVPFAIFFHEYIHFIQDITTVAGLSNFSKTVDYLKYCNEIVLASADKTFNIPIVPVPNAKDNVYFNTELSKIYLGDGKNVNGLEIVDISKTNISLSDGKQSASPSQITVTYKDAHGQKQSYNFGTICVMESMAYLCETSCFGSILPQPSDIPYFSAESIIKYLYPQLAEDKLNIIALCDASLSMFDSGTFFYDMVVLMRNSKWLPSAPEEIYDYCYSKPIFNFQGAKNIPDLLKKVGEEAIGQMIACFDSSYYSDNKFWIDYTLRTGMELRLSDPHFILDIIRGGSPKTNIKFIEIFKKIGMPSTTNREDVLRFHSPIQTKYNLKPEALWVINQIFNLYCDYRPSGNIKRCELKMFCKESCQSKTEKDFTNDYCYPSPWLRANEDPLCPFGAMWHTWSLKGFSVK